MNTVLLRDKTVVIYGGGGAIGGAVARVFAREGASVFIAGRTQAKLDVVAREIRAAGGTVHATVVDVLDQPAAERHADEVVANAGRIDVALNAAGFDHVQGLPFLELTHEEFARPIATYLRSNFITARAVSRHMVRQGSGVILTLSTPGARMSGKGFLGNGVASAGVEAFSRILAGELGANGIRVICLRPDAIPEAVPISHTREVFSGFAKRAGVSIESMLAERAQTGTLLGRFPTLVQVADYAAFVASDRAGAMTAAIANLSCGSLVD